MRGVAILWAAVLIVLVITYYRGDIVIAGLAK